MFSTSAGGGELKFFQSHKQEEEQNREREQKKSV